MENVNSEHEVNSEDENTQDISKEEIERDIFIYDFYYNSFQAEFQRNRDVEGKATGFLEFGGALFGFVAATGLYLLKDIISAPLFCVSYTLYLSSLAFLLFSIFSGISVLYLKEWQTINLSHFMEEYVKGEKTKSTILRKLIAEHEYASSKNRDTVNTKVKWLKRTIIFFVVAIVAICLFILSILHQYILLKL